MVSADPARQPDHWHTVAVAEAALTWRKTGPSLPAAGTAQPAS